MGAQASGQVNMGVPAPGSIRNSPSACWPSRCTSKPPRCRTGRRAAAGRPGRGPDPLRHHLLGGARPLRQEQEGAPAGGFRHQPPGRISRRSHLR
jgi:hypothetical protein